MPKRSSIYLKNRGWIVNKTKLVLRLNNPKNVFAEYFKRSFLTVKIFIASSSLYLPTHLWKTEI